MIKKILLSSILFITMSTIYCRDNYGFYFEHQIKSKILGKSIPISVYLPSGYDNLNEKYQSHYIFDGYLVGKAYAGILDYFSQLGEVPEGIVIGMGQNRKFESNKYSNFIKKELIPFIDSAYRTNNYRILVGHSSAGFHASQIYLNMPELFNSYVIGSPVEINIPFDHFLKDTITNLYIAFAENDFPEIVSKCNELLDVFQNDNNGSLIRIESISNKDHYSSLPIVIENSLEFIYQSWKLEFPQESDKTYPEIINEHYNKLSNKFGYKIIIQEKELYRLGYRLLKDNKIKTANELLVYSIELYPNSAFIRHLLGKSYAELNDVENAKLEYSKSLELFPDNKQARKEYNELLAK